MRMVVIFAQFLTTSSEHVGKANETNTWDWYGHAFTIHHQ